jgi:hypothetical protein
MILIVLAGIFLFYYSLILLGSYIVDIKRKMNASKEARKRFINLMNEK